MPTFLDTNILVHAVRRDAFWEVIKREFDPLMTNPAPVYSVVSDGEIRSLGKQWNWGADKTEQVEYLLSYFTRVTLDTDATMEAYATLDAFSSSRGIQMGKNDLWIAATACVLDATILTRDNDFDHLAPTFFDVAKPGT